MVYADSLGLAATVVALATATAAVVRAGAKAYGQTLGSRRALQRALDQIGPGVTVRHVESLLGPPVYTRAAQTEAEAGTFESIYFTRHAYVQVVHSGHGQVLAFGVTVFDPDFRPVIRQVPGLLPGYRKPRLGATTFSELPEPNALWLHCGLYRAHYNEVANYGRQGGAYYNFAFARNEAGVGRWGDSGPIHALGKLSMNDLRAQPPEVQAAWRAFRSATVVNTVCVYGDEVPRQLVWAFSFWRCGIDAEATPDLLQAGRGLLRRVRDRIRRG